MNTTGRLRPVWFLLLLAACSSPGTPRPERNRLGEFIRVGRTDDGVWTGETSVRTYRDPRSGATVSWLALIHTGSAAYYDGLTPIVAAADVVLAEGNGGQPPGRRLAPADLPPAGETIRRLHEANARLMGHIRQQAWEASIVDGRWRMADMETKQLFDALRSHGLWESPPSMQAATAQREQVLDSGSPEEQDRAREAYVRGLAGMIEADGSAPDTPMARLSAARERVMWDVIRDAIEQGGSQRIAVILGAEHCRNLAPRLERELGLELAGETWHEFLRYAPETAPSR